MVRLSEPFKHLMPSLPADVYAGLKASISANGQHVPILVDEGNNILDGHHRYRACCELGIEPVVSVVADIADDAEKRLRIYSLNLDKRDLSATERKAIERDQRAAALTLLAKGIAGREVARMVGRPETTIRRWKSEAGAPVAQGAEVPEVKAAEERRRHGRDQKPASMTPAERAAKDVADKTRALELIDGGMTAYAAAQAIGREPSTVSQWAADRDRRTGGERLAELARQRERLDATVAELASKGLGTLAIAKAIGTRRHAVTEAKKRAGVGKAAARAKNPLFRLTDRAKAEAAIWMDALDLTESLAKRATREQCLELAAHLEQLARAANTLKGRLNKEATNKEKVNGQELRGAHH